MVRITVTKQAGAVTAAQSVRPVLRADDEVGRTVLIAGHLEPPGSASCGLFRHSCPDYGISKLGKDGQVNVQSDTGQAADPQRGHSPLVLQAAELALKERARLHT